MEPLRAGAGTMQGKPESAPNLHEELEAPKLHYTPCGSLELQNPTIQQPGHQNAKPNTQNAQETLDTRGPLLAEVPGLILTSVAGPADAEVTVMKGGCIFAAEAGEPRSGGAPRAARTQEEPGESRGRGSGVVFPERSRQGGRASCAGRDWTVWVPEAGPGLQKDLGFPVPALGWGGPAG